MSRILKPRHVFGVNTKVRFVDFADDDTVVYPAGHATVLYHTREKRQRFIMGNDGTDGMSAMSISADKEWLAVSESRSTVTKGGAESDLREPAAVCVYELGTQKKKKILFSTAMQSGSYVASSFSADGKMLLTQGSSPDWQLVAWNWAKAHPVASATNLMGSTQVALGGVRQCSFCPTNSNYVCITGRNGVAFFRIADGTFKLADVPDDVTSGSLDVLCHAWVPSVDDAVVVSSVHGNLYLYSKGARVCNLDAAPGPDAAITSLCATSASLLAGCADGTVLKLDMQAQGDGDGEDEDDVGAELGADAVTAKQVLAIPPPAIGHSAPVVVAIAVSSSE